MSKLSTVNRRVEAGLCYVCEDPIISGGICCDDCAARRAERMRQQRSKKLVNTPAECKANGSIAKKGKVANMLHPITLKRFNRLPLAIREVVDASVKRHVKACFSMGVVPENIDRVYIEAMEIAQMEAAQPKPKAQEDAAIREPYRRYGQYQTPRHDLI